MECGVWSVECGVWSVECGVWSVVCGVLSVECGGDVVAVALEPHAQFDHLDCGSIVHLPISRPE